MVTKKNGVFTVRITMTRANSQEAGQAYYFESRTQSSDTVHAFKK